MKVPKKWNINGTLVPINQLSSIQLKVALRIATETNSPVRTDLKDEKLERSLTKSANKLLRGLSTKSRILVQRKRIKIKI